MCQPSVRDGGRHGTYSRSTCPERQGDRTRLDGPAGAGGDKHCLGTKIHDTRTQRNATSTATPATPTVPELPPTSPSGGVFGIYSSIVDASSQSHSLGRPEPLSNGYGRGTRRGVAGPARWYMTSAAGAFRVTVWTASSNTSDLAPPLVPLWNRVTSGPGSVRD